MRQSPPATGCPHQVPSVADLLEQMARDWPGDRLTLGDLVRALEHRGYGLLMLVLALPNAVPIGIPGLSAVLGLPLAAIAAQMAMGRPQPWLPRWLLRRSFSKRDFAAVIARCLPHVRRIERLMRPRWPQVTSPAGERLIGCLCVALGLLLSLPTPWTNTILSVPIAVLALALIARDGLVAVIGAAIAIVTGGFTLTASVVLLEWLARAVAWLGR